VKKRIQNLPFKFNLQRYNVDDGRLRLRGTGDGGMDANPSGINVKGGGSFMVRLYKLNPVYPWLGKHAWFQPLNLLSEKNWFPKFASFKFQLVPLHHGGRAAARRVQSRGGIVLPLLAASGGAVQVESS
jgi:hypothetical protein